MLKIKSITKAQSLYQTAFESIIYVGDQSWDYHASQQLGIHFIGIGKCFRELEKDIITFDNFNTPTTFLKIVARIEKRNAIRKCGEK